MKDVDIADLDLEELQGEWVASDWKDLEGLLQSFDSELAIHGLELAVGDRGDDNIWIKVVKQGAKKAKRPRKQETIERAIEHILNADDKEKK